MRIIDYNELNNFLFGKERKTKILNEKKNKALPATVVSEIHSQMFDSTQSLQVGGWSLVLFAVRFGAFAVINTRPSIISVQYAHRILVKGLVT